MGLATPASTMLVMGTWMWVEDSFDYFKFQYLLMIMTVVVAALLVAPIPMFSNKFKGSSFKGNELRYLFMAISVIGIAWQGRFAFAPIVLLYLTISFMEFFMSKIR
jgi:CDP-diacylglycerol---serine O-phosphatidyltransferase